MFTTKVVYLDVGHQITRTLGGVGPDVESLRARREWRYSGIAPPSVQTEERVWIRTFLGGHIRSGDISYPVLGREMHERVGKHGTPRLRCV